MNIGSIIVEIGRFFWTNRKQATWIERAIAIVSFLAIGFCGWGLYTENAITSFRTLEPPSLVVNVDQAWFVGFFAGWLVTSFLYSLRLIWRRVSGGLSFVAILGSFLTLWQAGHGAIWIPYGYNSPYEEFFLLSMSFVVFYPVITILVGALLQKGPTLILKVPIVIISDEGVRISRGTTA